MSKARRLALWIALTVAVLIAAAAVTIAVRFSGNRAVEVTRLVEVLGIGARQTVAEIGAGSGWFSVAVAQRVGPAGHVYSTELNERRLADIEAAVAEASLTNVTVVRAGEDTTHLADACCDAVFMRRVYHHISEPALVNASLHAALKRGGRLAIIEFRDDGWLGAITGMGIAPDRLIAEVSASGFRHVETSEWPGSSHYIALFQRP